MENAINAIQTTIRYWWVHLLLGIGFILVGIWVLNTPLLSYLSLSILFSVLMFASGFAEVVFSVSNRKELDGWGWHLAAGIVDFLIGLLLISYPALTMAVLPLFVAFWLMCKGLSAIGTSLDMKRYGVDNWGWLLAAGIVGVLCAFLMITNPILGGMGLVYMTASALIATGVFRIVLAFRLQKLKRAFSR